VWSAKFGFLKQISTLGHAVGLNKTESSRHGAKKCTLSGYLAKLLQPGPSFADPVWSRRAAALRPPSPDSICFVVVRFFSLTSLLAPSRMQLGVPSWGRALCSLHHPDEIDTPASRECQLPRLQIWPACPSCELSFFNFFLLSEEKRRNLEQQPAHTGAPAAQLGSIRQ